MTRTKTSMLNAVAAILSMLLGTAATLAQQPQGDAGNYGVNQQTTPLPPSIKRTYVPLGAARGYLYEPVAAGDKSHTGIFVMHERADYMYFSTCTELSKRGYTVLCATNSGLGMDPILLDAKASMIFLRAYPGIRRIVLWGHSGGATLLTAYQQIAENGVKVCQGPEKLAKCGDNLTGFPKADGVILADSNWGNAEMAVMSLDPAVSDEKDATKLDSSYDLYDPANGYKVTGATYSEDFVRRYQRAAAKRENSLIQAALARVAAIDAGKGHFADDEPFVVPGGNSAGINNKLFAQDLHLMSHTRKPWPLLHADGSVTNQIVYSVRVPENSSTFTPKLARGALNTTVRSFLKNNAIRVSEDYGFGADSVHGIDWTSSYSSTPGNVTNIHVPLLVAGMTGHWEYLAAETIYAQAASADKTLVFVEGAEHGYATCKACEKTPGQFGDTIKTLYDYADKWLSKPERFAP